MSESRAIRTSYYGVNPKKEHLRSTFADNTKFDPNAMAAASWDYPLGTMLHVLNPKTGVNHVVEVKDRGPNKRLLVDSKLPDGRVIPGRQLDLTVGAYKALGLDTKAGIGDIVITPVANAYANALRVGKTKNG